MQEVLAILREHAWRDRMCTHMASPGAPSLRLWPFPLLLTVWRVLYNLRQEPYEGVSATGRWKEAIS